MHGYVVRERDLFARSIKIKAMETKRGQMERTSADRDEASRELPADNPPTLSAASEDNCLSKHSRFE